MMGYKNEGEFKSAMNTYYHDPIAHMRSGIESATGKRPTSLGAGPAPAADVAPRPKTSLGSAVPAQTAGKTLLGA